MDENTCEPWGSRGERSALPAGLTRASPHNTSHRICNGILRCATHFMVSFLALLCAVEKIKIDQLLVRKACPAMMPEEKRDFIPQKARDGEEVSLRRPTHSQERMRKNAPTLLALSSRVWTTRKTNPLQRPGTRKSRRMADIDSGGVKPVSLEEARRRLLSALE